MGIKKSISSLEKEILKRGIWTPAILQSRKEYFADLGISDDSEMYKKTLSWLLENYCEK